MVGDSVSLTNIVWVYRVKFPHWSAISNILSSLFPLSRVSIRQMETKMESEGVQSSNRFEGAPVREVKVRRSQELMVVSEGGVNVGGEVSETAMF